MAPAAPVALSRPTHEEVVRELTRHIEALAGPGATPRPEQLAAVRAVVADGQRTLLVARTGFGKSAVYFSATRMLRDRGWGPTVVVSPLLALMRDQVAAARRLGLAAETINSANLDDWDRIEQAVRADEVDLLLISPERLANQGFRDRVFELLRSQPMALVCDEAHCISDWGHDFRPDYLRLRHLLDELPPTTPVLATTATANRRVTDDVAGQLGEGTVVLRTSLDRASLRLRVVDLPDDSHRYAWLATELGRLDGSGIIYCLTQDQAASTAQWLRDRGHAVAAYTGSTPDDERLRLEDALRANELRALVATSALGMGFDKGDLAFCIHLGLPPTPVAYYQQIGRAGRALEAAHVVAMPRAEDEQVWRWFEQVSLPSESTCLDVLDQLRTTRPTSVPTLETRVNLGRSRLQTLLKILEVDGAVTAVQGGFLRTTAQWRYDHDKADRLRALRSEEAEDMRRFATLTTCRLRFLREQLDDAEAADCGRCDNCVPAVEEAPLDQELIGEASRFLRGGDVVLEPRRQWPSGLDEPRGRIPAELQARPGRALGRIGGGGWASAIDAVLAGDARVDEDLVRAAGAVLKRWDWPSRPTWICPVPSRRHHDVVDRLTRGLSQIGSLPIHHAIVRDDGGGFQADQSNSAHQVANVWGRLRIDESALPDARVRSGPVLLVDDESVSGWTLTVAAALLGGCGAGPVLPFVLRVS